MSEVRLRYRSTASSGGIFASPAEPIFLKPECMKPELLQEWLKVLAEQNSQAIKKATFKEGCFVDGRYADFVFLTCDRLKLNSEAKYLTVHLFDKFMSQHVQDLHDHVRQLQTGSKRKTWESIMGRVQNQVLLRIVSCCQIASKLTSHYRIITQKRAQEILQSFGHRYNHDSLQQSELRVLKTLNWDVMLTTPLIYLDALLQILGHNHRDTQVKTFHAVSLKLLDLFYLSRQHIYQQLRKYLQSETVTPTQRSDLPKLEYNHMLLSVGIIAAASYILDQTTADQVMENLSQITLIPFDDILNFATVLIKTVVEDKQSIIGAV